MEYEVSIHCSENMDPKGKICHSCWEEGSTEQHHGLVEQSQSTTLPMHSTAVWVWQGGLFALWCFFRVLLVCYFQLITRRRVRRVKFFSVIFPTWGCIGVLLKGEKTLWFSFMVLSCTFDVLEHWKIPKGWWGFPPLDWLLCTSQLLNHRRNHQRKRDTKGQGSLNRKRIMCTGDLPLHYKAKLPKTTPKASWIWKRNNLFWWSSV